MILISKGLVLAVRLYQLFISPIMRLRGVRCLRTPTCSEYAVLALNKHPLPKALKMIRNRISDCRAGAHRSFVDYP